MCRGWLLVGLLFVMAGCTTTGGKSSTNSTPLSAVYYLDRVYSTPIKIHVKGKTSDMDIIHEAVFDTTEIPIHGLYQNYNNTVVLTINGQEITTNIRIADQGIANATIYTDKLPDADPYNQDLYFTGVNNINLCVVGYDRKGDPRYYLGGLRHVAAVFYTNDQILVRYAARIRDLFGNTVVDYSAQTDYTTHHDSIQINNGNYVVLVTSTWGKCDRVVELSEHGTRVRDLYFGDLFWDIVTDSSDLAILKQIIYDDKNIYKDNGANKQIDWAHANSLVYDSETDIMYFSLRQQAVIAVDYSEWKLLWWMADDNLNTLHAGVPNEGVNFTKVPSLQSYRVGGAGASDGPKNQHALFLLENGNLGMFDNQGDETTSTTGSRYVEYAISQSGSSYTATKAREYRDSSLYSRIMSDVDFTGEGNLLMTWGVPYRMREVNLDTQEVLFDISFKVASWGMYRGDKMPLYPYTDTSKAYSEDANLKN